MQLWYAMGRRLLKSVGLGVLLGAFLSGCVQQNDPSVSTNGVDSAAEDELESITGPVLTAAFGELRFGVLSPGQRETRQLVMTNTGSQSPVTVLSASIEQSDGEVFFTDFEGPVVVEYGRAVSVPVTFAPQVAGEQQGSLSVSHSGPGRATRVDLFGSIDDVSSQIDVRPPITTRAVPNSVIFGKSSLGGVTGITPTSLQFGPDGRLYAADIFGDIKAYTITRNFKNNYSVSETETISLVKNLPNHDDDGTPNPSVTGRLVTGLLVEGTAEQPVIYVVSSDPRIGGGPAHSDTNLDTNSGILSRLTLENSGWSKLDLVRGLARSEENHTVNGLVLDSSGTKLLLAAGGNTNQGGVSNNFALLPEYALSAAILEVDLTAIGESTYDLPTLDDETRAGVNDQYDPFGGNNGLNQAMLVSGSPVQVYAPGFRNPYDLVITELGHLFSIDNGGNAGWGAPPIGVNTDFCTNELSEPGSTEPDRLHFIDQPGYSGGHPNPTRASTAMRLLSFQRAHG